MPVTLAPSAMQPQRQPRALEASMARQQHALAAPERASPRRSMPDLPWRLAGCPELFQHRLVAQGIHRLPETAMLERHHLPHGGETDDGRAFPAAVVALDKIETRAATERKSRR